MGTSSVSLVDVGYQIKILGGQLSVLQSKIERVAHLRTQRAMEEGWTGEFSGDDPEAVKFREEACGLLREFLGEQVAPVAGAIPALPSVPEVNAQPENSPDVSVRPEQEVLPLGKPMTEVVADAPEVEDTTSEQPVLGFEPPAEVSPAPEELPVADESASESAPAGTEAGTVSPLPEEPASAETVVEDAPPNEAAPQRVNLEMQAFKNACDPVVFSGKDFTAASLGRFDASVVDSRTRKRSRRRASDYIEALVSKGVVEKVSPGIFRCRAGEERQISAPADVTPPPTSVVAPAKVSLTARCREIILSGNWENNEFAVSAAKKLVVEAGVVGTMTEAHDPVKMALRSLKKTGVVEKLSLGKYRLLSKVSAVFAYGNHPQSPSGGLPDEQVDDLADKLPAGVEMISYTGPKREVVGNVDAVEFPPAEAGIPSPSLKVNSREYRQVFDPIIFNGQEFSRAQLVEKAASQFPAVDKPVRDKKIVDKYLERLLLNQKIRRLKLGVYQCVEGATALPDE